MSGFHVSRWTLQLPQREHTLEVARLQMVMGPSISYRVEDIQKQQTDVCSSEAK